MQYLFDYLPEVPGLTVEFGTISAENFARLFGIPAP